MIAASRTHDRHSPFHTTAVLGRTQETTREGFLVCHDVPIAAVGEMLYAAGEVPLKPGPDGIVRVTRDAETLLADETVRSFEGKPVTMDHPPEDVSPANWRRHVVGTTHRVRVGDGDQAGMLVADLLLSDQRAIDAVRRGQREVSCGYDADYEQTGPGTGRQSSILGNHVALVARGRCGPRCAIGDSQMTTTTKTKTTFRDRIRAAFHTRDEVALDEAIEDAPASSGEGRGEDHHITINLDGVRTHDDGELAAAASGTANPIDPTPPPDPVTKALSAIMARLDTIDSRLSDLEADDSDDDDDEDMDPDDLGDADDDGAPDEVDPDADGDGVPDKKPTTDRAARRPGKKGRTSDTALADEHSDTVSRAEILAPGIRLPTFDRARSRQATRDALCALRRRALDAAMAGEHRTLVAPILAGLSTRRMTCDEATLAFRAASELVRSSTTRDRLPVHHDRAKSTVKVPTIADINTRNREFWDKRRSV